MVFPISTRALVVPLSALSTTILLSLSAVINWLTCRIRSGLPTEVPPNFMILNWLILFFWVRKDREFHFEFNCEGPEVFDDGGDKWDAFGEAKGFHFTFGIAGN